VWVAKFIELIHTSDMPGKWYTELYEIAADQYGFITTADLVTVGARDQVLVDMERHGHLGRVARGLYRFRTFPITSHDELMGATLWPNRLGVISHESALDLWDLCDVNPVRIHVSIPKLARIRRRVPDSYVVHPRNLDASDVGTVDGIPAVTPRRAILDGIERHLDTRLLRQALDSVRSRGLVSPVELDDIEHWMP
jgi:predicted transcriptional regulator of viral defense system